MFCPRDSEFRGVEFSYFGLGIQEFSSLNYLRPHESVNLAHTCDTRNLAVMENQERSQHLRHSVNPPNNPKPALGVRGLVEPPPFLIAAKSLGERRQLRPAAWVRVSGFKVRG